MRNGSTGIGVVRRGRRQTLVRRLIPEARTRSRSPKEEGAGNESEDSRGIGTGQKIYKLRGLRCLKGLKRKNQPEQDQLLWSKETLKAKSHSPQ